MSKITKAIIPAAGFGTRFLPATKSQPKEMLPVVDKPTIQYIVEEAVESGIEDILIVIGRYKSVIEDHFDRSVELEMELEKKGQVRHVGADSGYRRYGQYSVVRQKTALGLGHAVYCAKISSAMSLLRSCWVMILWIRRDTPCLKQMMDLYEQGAMFYFGREGSGAAGHS